MALTKAQIEEIRRTLDESKKPLFFFDDDPDGLCSFLQLYRYKREGHGIPVKSVPNLDAKFLRKVEEYDPDVVFVLDLAQIEDEFAGQCKVPILWIDHHDPVQLDGVTLYNPKLNRADKNYPTSYLCYEVIKQDIWLATAGCVGDWFLPDFAAEFAEKNPDLLPEDISTPEEALFGTRLGTLIKAMSSALKGKTSDVKKAIKVLSRIEDPREILDQTTPQGRFIHSIHEKINKEYERIKANLKKSEQSGEYIIYIYHDNKMSFSKELANEMLFEHPDKVIIIGRLKDSTYRISIRGSHYNVPQALQPALQGLQGRGGGHLHACGCSVAKDDFDTFIERFKEEISNQEPIKD